MSDQEAENQTPQSQIIDPLSMMKQQDQEQQQQIREENDFVQIKRKSEIKILEEIQNENIEQMDVNAAEDEVVRKLRQSLCMDQEDMNDLHNQIGLERGPRIDSGSFDKMENMDEDDNPYVESTANIENSEYTLIDSKKEAQIDADYIQQHQDQDIMRQRTFTGHNIVFEQSDDEDQEPDTAEDTRSAIVIKPDEQKKDKIDLDKNIDTLLVRESQKQKLKEESIQLELLNQQQRINMFETNRAGFVKRKELANESKEVIQGLSHLPGVNPTFDVLYGEREVYNSKKYISCESSFQLEYLKQSSNPNFRAFCKIFRLLPGYLQLTNYRLLFIPHLDPKLVQILMRQPRFVRDLYSIPLGKINRIERKVEDQNKHNKYNQAPSSHTYLEIYTKDNRKFKFIFANQDRAQCLETYNQLEKHCFCIMEERCLLKTFPYQYKIDVNDDNWTRYHNGWSIFQDIRTEVQRMGIDLTKSQQFKLTDNTRYDICKTYPNYLVVPLTMNRDKVIQCSKFRTKNRFPALSYYHGKTGTSLWRSSQCMNGLMNHRMMEDEIMLLEIGKTANSNKTMINNSKVHIFDARPKLNAQANKYIKNGGFEDLKYYRNCEITFCDIDNIHEVSKCFRKMYDIIDDNKNFNTMVSYQPMIESSGYNQMISRILKATNNVVDTMINKKTNVLVHCSDGWDRTAQMCALTQQCIDPYYRTIQGFATLIEKDWLSFGHQFHLRFGHMDRNYKEEQRSPVFIQYLDCVRQLILQYPFHFEYNQELLLFIADELFNNKYGTFLMNHHKDRKKYDLPDKTESMWTYVMMESLRFTNKFYDPKNTKGYIMNIPLTVSFSVKEWREYFFKWCEYGYCQQNQNVTQSYFDGNTKQALNLFEGRLTKKELQDILREQQEVLGRLEKQIAPPPPKVQVESAEIKKSSDEKDKEESLDASFSIEGDSNMQASPKEASILQQVNGKSEIEPMEELKQQN